VVRLRMQRQARARRRAARCRRAPPREAHTRRSTRLRRRPGRGSGVLPRVRRARADGDRGAEPQCAPSWRTDGGNRGAERHAGMVAGRGPRICLGCVLVRVGGCGIARSSVAPVHRCLRRRRRTGWWRQGGL
jgi:hypothetical protein